MSERRRFRRAELSEAVAVSLQPKRGESGSEPIVGRVKNISLAGLLCHIPGACALQPGDEVNCHVSIPPPQRRTFPFQRVLGRGTIIRVMPDTASQSLAVAFMPDVTALGTIEY